MPRVKRGFKARRRRNRVLSLAKGYRGARSRCFNQAKETVIKGLCYAYRDRKTKKRNYRGLWIIRINAACREHGLSYSLFMNALNKAGIELDRKMLANLAVTDTAAFNALMERAKTV
jgi:large subunit ribosomal protein L20